MFSQGPSWKNSQLTCGAYILSRSLMVVPTFKYVAYVLSRSLMAVHLSLNIFLLLRCAPLSTYACREEPIETVNHMYTTQLSSSMRLASWLSFRWLASWWSSSPSFGKKTFASACLQQELGLGCRGHNKKTIRTLGSCLLCWLHLEQGKRRQRMPLLVQWVTGGIFRRHGCAGNTNTNASVLLYHGILCQSPAVGNWGRIFRMTGGNTAMTPCPRAGCPCPSSQNSPCSQGDPDLSRSTFCPAKVPGCASSFCGAASAASGLKVVIGCLV